MTNDEQLAVKQTSDMLAMRREQYGALRLSSATLKEIRNMRLRALLTHAKANSPWYRKHLAKINVENFTEEQLCEISPINKITLMENWDEIVTKKNLSLSLVEKHIEKMATDENALYLLDRYHVLASSGSSGKRGVFIYDWDEWNNYYLHFRRYGLYDKNGSDLLFTPTKKLKIAMVVISNVVYSMYSMAKTFKSPNAETFHFPMTLPIHQIVEGLNNVQPDILQGTPTTIQKLCQEAEEGRLAIQPRVISVGGESLYKPIRRLINKIWPEANIFNTLGSSEGLIGVNCRANSEEMHLNDDACIVEPVDRFSRLVDKETVPDRLYLTNLYNYTLPLIRYELSDQLFFLKKVCKCGVQHQLISEPQGRPEFDFTYSGNVFVHHLTFVTPLLHENNVREYQVIQTRNGAEIKLLTTGFVDKNRLQKTICSKLSELGVNKPIIDLIEVSEFNYPASGKLKRFIKFEC